MKVLMMALLFSLFTAQAWAEKQKEGQQLHDAHCTGCHDSAVYTRKDRKVNTLAQLEAQIRRCEGQLSLQWFDEDVHTVASYLNASYYHFE